MNGTPSPRNRLSHGVQNPRLQTKPWTRTTPLRAGAVGGTGNWSGIAFQRNGCHQPKTIALSQVEVHQALANCHVVGCGAGSERPTTRKARNSAPSTRARPTQIATGPPSATTGEARQCHANHPAAPASRNSTRVLWKRARLEERCIRRASPDAP